MDPTLLIKLVGGLVYLLLGGDILVRGSVALARRFRVSPTVIALTVVAFGTSLPELVVVVRAALTGYPGLVFGNVVGSNIANVLLVAGAAAAVYPLYYGERSIRRDTLFMLAATGLLIILSIGGLLGRFDGLILLAVLAAITTLTASEAAQAYRDSELKTPMEWVLGLPTNPWMIALFIVAGAVALPIGADLVVNASVRMAENLGVSETIIGLTILAIGTSLPELATTVVAAVQKRTEVAVGTIVGSNTFNLLAIMGVGAVLSPFPIEIPREFFTIHFPVMLGTALLISVFVWLRRPIGRMAGVAFLAAYAAYLAMLAVRTVAAAG
ncbi:MAG: calcium/sodium antiporter [marine benthic group bacterium]|nr:calcium/sodium antiporter [Gemmatimonadota bacterium]MCL7968213.1 calcium/sodium antiporter [Gemmatimonadota bacterium]